MADTNFTLLHPTDPKSKRFVNRAWEVPVNLLNGEPVAETVVDHDGTDLPLGRAGDAFTIGDGDIRATFTWWEDVNLADDEYADEFFHAARFAYDNRLLEVLRSRKGLIPELDGKLDEEIAAVVNRRKYNPTGMVEPDITAVAVDDLIRGSALIGQPVPIAAVNAEADAALVTDEGITYLLLIDMDAIRRFVTTENGGGLDWGKVENWFTTEYGATLRTTELGDLTAEIRVPWGKEGADHTSVQSMGERADSETELTGLRYDRDNHEVSRKLAKAADAWRSAGV